MKLCLFDERQDEIVDASHDLCKIANSHAEVRDRIEAVSLGSFRFRQRLRLAAGIIFCDRFVARIARTPPKVV